MKKVLVAILLIAVVSILAGCTQQAAPKKVGESCSINADCLTKNCGGGVCQLNGVGGYCQNDSYCLEGICKASICSKATMGERCSDNLDCGEGRKCYPETKTCLKVDNFFCSTSLEYGKLSPFFWLFGIILLVAGIFVGGFIKTNGKYVIFGGALGISIILLFIAWNLSFIPFC